ncbi:MAG TPA: hypothetical protein GXX39_03940 [Syntrophothermus lipocalidus]|uniref:Uncharacterized protein n=1 Tax=Syntrophothermus lipocalidus (strain DSM 12680 / TGB-C1) TaxID=643648 RepID=D7CMZ8_SYNLT|nr:MULTISPECIES: hypothetical protein [Syntrophothermus]ADI02083.1 conserved hypothetical protein [Syntrophothermus lipocalidus DSM 12680]NSW82454.1 hypothetical protein [Syntrophothermus sp.]HHV76511.1 hypothetical protein [Syntrophothermus lipocalidus]HOV42404.1 hypothetical protein [Syntrophothermus lipocalidus]
MAKRGTSNAPMILGIVGAFVSLPNILCASTCGAVVGAGMTDSAGGLGMGAALGFIPVILGFIAAFYGKSKPTFCGISMFICAAISLITVIMTAFTSLFGWAALILFLIAGIIAFVQPMEEIPEN